MSNEDVINENEEFDGCLCEYIREDYKERLERLIAANGGGEPGTITSFTNVIIQVNDAIRRHLALLENATTSSSATAKRGRKITQRKGKLTGAGL